jgi:hypothetical protein
MVGMLCTLAWSMGNIWLAADSWQLADVNPFTFRRLLFTKRYALRALRFAS